MSAGATVLSLFQRDTGAYILAPPTFPTNSKAYPFAANKMYISVFAPKNKMWFGDLKSFTLQKNGLADNSDLIATHDGPKTTPYYIWSPVPTGEDASKGGLAETLARQLQNSVRRNVYTYIEYPPTGSASANLTSRQNAITVSNKNLTASMLGVPEKFRSKLINDIRERELGAIIHSRPLFVEYPFMHRTVFFIGSNDGFLHCIDNFDGSELWAFAAPEHLRLLKNADPSIKYQDPPDPAEEEKPKPLVNRLLTTSFADNSPALYTSPQKQKVLVYGMGSGGYTYVALDITDFANPQFLYTIKANFLGLGQPHMGQSYGKPQFCKVPADISAKGAVKNQNDCVLKDTSLTFDDVHDVMLLPGGYDIFTRKDDDGNDHSLRGTVVLGVDPVTGEPDPAFSQLNSAASPIMQHAVVEITAINMANHNITEGLYFGDMGGNLFFAMQYAAEPTHASCPLLKGTGKTATNFTATNRFVPYKLFQTGNPQALPKAPPQKILFRPDVVRDKDGILVYFGTGDRENHSDTTVRNKFYCIKFNSWQYLTYNVDEPRHLTEADLADVTENIIQDGQGGSITKAQRELAGKKGWMLTLDEGEKVVSQPVVFNGIVFFTTYKPYTVRDRFRLTPEARLYALDYKTGAAVFNWNKVPVYPNKIDKAQRSKVIGNIMPSAPEVVLFRDRAALYVACGNQIMELPLPYDPVSIFFWREIY